MTEPPRPPGAGNPDDPAYGSSPPPPPTPPGYGAPPPGSGAPYGSPPPTSDPGYGAPPPTSGSGYGAPPPPADPGYGPGHGFVPQPGYAPGPEDKLWIQIAHFGGAAGALLSLGVGGWIAPVIALVAKGNQSPAVRAEAAKAINFQLIWSIVAVIGWITICLSWLIVPIAMLMSIIFGVIAGARATNNEPYNYPLTYPLIK